MSKTHGVNTDALDALIEICNKDALTRVWAPDGSYSGWTVEFEESLVMEDGVGLVKRRRWVIYKDLEDE